MTLATGAAAPSTFPEQYERVLAQFPRYAARGLRDRTVGGRRFTIFGSGGNDENGMRTLGSFAFTSALLAARERIDPAGASRDQLLGWARSAVGYMCATHLSATGAGDGPSVARWGHNWQSAWWATRMALGARLVWDRLDDAERQAVRAVVVGEADALVGVPARTGLFRDTKAEENAWDSEILATAVALFPDHANAPAWRRTLIDFAVNSLSAPQDRLNGALVDGRPLAEQVYTVNVHSDFTVENHGPHHFCYVASPLHSLVWGQYALRAVGLDVPEALWHNVRPTWARAATMFLDNRFAYPCGQDWARYTYGAYFILPVAAMLARVDGDEVAHTIERLRLARFADEQAMNGDGSFFGRRVTRGITTGQHGKYETDCYANVALAYLIGADRPAPCEPLPTPELRRRTRAAHASPEGGLCYVRGERLFASFSWDCLEGPTPIALFVPDGCDDATEWAPGNMLGAVHTRHAPELTVAQRRMAVTDRGFRAEGRIAHKMRRSGWWFDHDVFVELLEDEGVMVVENRFRARQRLLVTSACGMRLFLPNDLFNDCRRSVHTPGGTVELTFTPPDRGGAPAEGKLARKVRGAARRLGFEFGQDRRPLPGAWINVDDRIGIVCDRGGTDNGAAPAGFSVVREARRNAPWSSLYCERIELGATGPRRCERGSDILTSRYLVVAGDRQRTADLAGQLDRYRPLRLRPYAEIR